MVASPFMAFLGQLRAYMLKTYLTHVVRHPITLLIRSYGLSIAFLVILLEIPYFAARDKRYGVGPTHQLAKLADTIPTDQQIVIVTQPWLGSDADRVLEEVSKTLRPDSVMSLTSDEDIALRCRANRDGATPCHISLTIFDSPMTNASDGRNHTWEYIIRTSEESRSYHAGLELDGMGFSQKIVLPLQLAVDNAITNSSLNPNVFGVTSQTQEEADKEAMETFQNLMAQTYAFAFTLPSIILIFHVASAITTERASGMSLLVDAMGGGPVVRLLGQLLVFDLLFLPLWIVYGALYWYLAWRVSTSAGIIIVWQILTGLATNSSALFAAAFFKHARVAPVYIMGVFLLMGVAAMMYSYPSINSTPTTAGIGALSFVFPSFNLVMWIEHMCYWQADSLPADLNKLSPRLLEILEYRGNQPYNVTPSMLLGFLVAQIFFYPVAAILVERLMHGLSYRNRTFSNQAEDKTGTVVETSELKKTFTPTLMQKVFCCGRKRPVTAVDGVTLAGNRGEILGLVGPNGSGKTTTLQMIAGFLKPTKGTITLNALPSQIGVCPQNNTLWDDLTVEEHLKIWNDIKGGKHSPDELRELMTACDISAKSKTQARALSGGQQRKLQLACMFVGNSSVCLIDECTSGLDPLSRRIIWEILLEQRARRSIIFTTHFLDEVEVLADNIAILSKGKVKCQGPATELKNLHGGGYKVLVPRSADPIPTVYSSTSHQDRTVYATPDSASAAQLTAAMFRRGQRDVSILGPQFEDVFLRVARDSEFHDVPSVTDHHGTPLSTGTATSFGRQIRALFWKRIVVMKRFWWPYLWVLALPLVITPNMKYAIDSYKELGTCDYLPPTLTSARPATFDITTCTPSAWSASYCSTLILGGDAGLNTTLVDMLNRNFTAVMDYSSTASRNGSKVLPMNITNYNERLRVAKDFDEFMAYMQSEGLNVGPGGIYQTSNSDSPTLGLVADSGRLADSQLLNLLTMMRSGIKITARSGSFAAYASYSSRNAGTIFYLILFCLVQTIYPAAFVFYPTIEKARKVRALQYANGIRRAPLWTAYTLFDMLFVFVISVAISAHLIVQIPFWYGSAGYMFLILFLYGVAAVLLNQILTNRSKSGPTAFMVAFGCNLVMFIIVTIAFSMSMSQNAANVGRVLKATTYGINILFPIGNVWRAASIGLNAANSACDDGKFITPGSFAAYGSPILYLFLQVFGFLALVIWLEREHTLPTLRARFGKRDAEKAAAMKGDEVENEQARVESTESDLLKVLHLTKSFGSNVAVDDMTLGLANGEVMALIGPNGAGKSTLVNLIRNELRPDSGSVFLRGENAKTPSAQRHLGVCPQYDALDLLSTREHLAFYAKIKGIKDINGNVNAIMARLGLTPHAATTGSKLSGGNKRKLSLAIALIGMPPVIILDEPTSAMDAVAKRSFWKIIEEISSDRSVLLTTHSMEEADALASRAAIMSKRLLAIGTTQALRQRYSNIHYGQLLLKTAPHSTLAEMQGLKDWVLTNIPGARLEREPLGGQVRFTVPGPNASASHANGANGVNGVPRPKESGHSDGDDETLREEGENGNGGTPAIKLIEQLEREKDNLGVEYYSVGGATLENVFLSVVRENNVMEENEEKKRSWWLRWL